ncbi:MAG TPA: 1,4-alpha-glucan branching protein [Streptosporangiaceae bacterium]|nr:1,4-alpha-glucan branching protein [Streptosporangiaceae bacterium]
MAVIHRTTLTPGKLELLTAWLPAQPWYAGTERQPALARAGGFRLDDPAGEVGIEFMVVTDSSGDRPVNYHVPLSYRAAPLDGADDALIGTAEHGVLGTRWIYDGPHDPVLASQLLALLQGEAEPQAQRVSDTPDRTVTSHFAGPRVWASLSSLTVTSGAHGSDISVGQIRPGDRDGELSPEVTVRVMRVLEPLQQEPRSPGYVTATWREPDGAEGRGLFVEVSARAGAAL